MLTQYTAATAADLTAQANKIINAVPASDPLYVALYKAEHTFDSSDYLTITDQVNQILLNKGVDPKKLQNHSFLDGSALQKYYVMGAQYTKLKAEADYKALVSNANNAINTVLKAPGHYLYKVLLQAKACASENDYLVITRCINGVLRQCGADFTKLTEKSFLNGTAFQAYYLLPKEYAEKYFALHGGASSLNANHAMAAWEIRSESSSGYSSTHSSTRVRIG